MKAFVSRLALAIGLFFFAASAASAQVLPAPSHWVNDKTSTLDIWSVIGGKILGEFTNQAEGFECKGIPYPAVGAVLPNGNLYFVVTFAKCNSITRWKGYVRGSQIMTTWTLLYIDSNGSPAKLKGSDIFTKQ